MSERSTRKPLRTLGQLSKLLVTVRAKLICESYLDEDEWKWQLRDDPVLHIELRKWADMMLVAPLSANTLAKLSNGISDNLLVEIAVTRDFHFESLGSTNHGRNGRRCYPQIPGDSRSSDEHSDVGPPIHSQAAQSAG